MTTISHLFCSASGSVIKESETFYLTALSKSASSLDKPPTALSIGFPVRIQENQISLVDTRKNLKHVVELIAFLTKSLPDASIRSDLIELRDTPSKAIDYLFKMSTNNKILFTHKTKDYYLKFSAVGAQHILDFDIDTQEQLSLYKMLKDFSLKVAHQFQYARKNEDLEVIIDYSIEEAIAKLLCEVSSPLCVKEEYPWCHVSSIEAIKQSIHDYVDSLQDCDEKVQILPRNLILKVLQEMHFVLKYAATLSIVAGALCPARVLMKGDQTPVKPGKTFS